MASSRELRVLEALWQNTVQIIEADLFYVVLFNKVSVKLDFPLVAQKSEGQWERLPRASQEYRPDARLPDAIFRDHRPVLTGPDVENWLTYREKLVTLTDQRPLSWLGVPMLVGDNVIGVIVVENHRREGAYDAHTQSLVRTMADRVAGALAQTRMIDNLRAVNKVGQALTAGIHLQEREILGHIFQQASQLMNTDNMYIALLDTERQMLNFPLAREKGLPERLPAREIVKDIAKGGLTEIVLRSKEPLLIANVETYCREKKISLPIEPESPPKSWLGVPLVYENQILGIISLRNYEIENLYGPDDQEVLQAMAGQAAVAIENARLYENVEEKVRERTRRLAALFNIAQSLNSAIRSQQQDMLKLIAEQIGSVMDARSMYIALYDSEQQWLSFPLARKDGKPELFSSRKAELPDRSETDFAKIVEFINKTQGGLTEIVLHQEKSLLIGNVEAYCEKHRLRLPITPMPKSWLGVPIMLEYKILGIISLQSDEFENAYSNEDLEVLQTMAGQAAVALENARLYGELDQTNVKLTDLNENLEARVRERTKQLTALQDIGVRLASMTDLREVLSAIVQYAKEIIAADFCVLFPYDHKKNEFEKGIWVHDIDVELAIPTSSGLTASLAQKQESYFAEDATKEPGKKPALPEGKEIRSFACIPLIARGNTVGVLYVNYFTPHKFSTEEREIAQLLCNQAAVAFENARLYEEARGEAAAAKQIAILGTAMATLQHRINNTLNVIIPNVTRLRRRVDMTDPVTVEILDIIDRNARYTSEIISKIQDQLRTGELQKVNINSVITELLRGFRELRKADSTQPLVNVETKLDESLPLLTIPVGKMTEVLRNLIDNAYRVMKKGGQLTVATSLSNNSVEIRIQDSGPGIPPDIEKRIFKQPVPSSEQRGGAGLGLWLSQLTLQSLGGCIIIEQTSMSGTVMLVSIPLPEIQVKRVQ